MTEQRHRLPGFLAGMNKRHIGQWVRATGTWLRARARSEPEPEETDEDRAWRFLAARDRQWFEIFELRSQAESEAEPEGFRASQEYLDAIESRWTEANQEVLNEVLSRGREAEV